jgi:hypothetical protein
MSAPTACDIILPEALRELLVNTRFGLGLDPALLDSATYTNTWNFCDNQNFRGSVLIESETDLLRAIETILAHYGGWLAWYQGTLKFGARRDEPATRDLVVDDALQDGEPAFEMPGERDTANRVVVDYPERDRRYNTAQVYVGDDFERLQRERITRVSMPFYCASEPAKKIAASMLYQRAAPGVTVTVALGPKDMALAPGDVVTLTSKKHGLVQHRFRVVAVGEDERRGAYRAQLLEEPTASLLLAAYQVQPDNPGDPPPPPTEDAGPTTGVIWELPAEVAGEGVVRLAFLVGGADPEWRGASVYMGLAPDAVDQRVAVVLGGAPVGYTESGLGGTPAYDDLARLDVDLAASGGTLASVTRDDALALRTLAVVGTEPLAYRQADLLAAGRYALRGLFRGPFDRGQNVISVGYPFGFIGVFTGGAIYDPPPAYVGRTLYFKFASVNSHGQEQDLAGLPVYAFPVRGVAQEPAPVHGLQVREGGVLQGSRRVIGPGQVDVTVAWRYARRDNPEDADLVNGAEVQGKEPQWLDYLVRVYTKATAGGAYGLRRAVSRSTEDYTYGAADNLADNGAYHRFIKFEVTTRRSGGKESRRQALEVEVAP